MNETAQHLIDGLLELEAAIGASINWGGKDFPCSGGVELSGKKLNIGGYSPDADVTVVIRSALFDQNNRPSETQPVTYKATPDSSARRLRISNATLFQNAVLVLQCNDVAQKA